MHHLDTANRFHARSETPTRSSMGSIEMRRLADGRVEIIAEQASKKFDSKRWHRETVMLTISPEQAELLKAALESGVEPGV